MQAKASDLARAGLTGCPELMWKTRTVNRSHSYPRVHATLSPTSDGEVRSQATVRGLQKLTAASADIDSTVIDRFPGTWDSELSRRSAHGYSDSVVSRCAIIRGSRTLAWPVRSPPPGRRLQAYLSFFDSVHHCNSQGNRDHRSNGSCSKWRPTERLAVNAPEIEIATKTRRVPTMSLRRRFLRSGAPRHWRDAQEKERTATSFPLALRAR